MKDFFISYTKADQPWAEWIAWKLEEAGYSTVIQVWDFLPGSNFVLEMQRAATEANRTIAVLSQKYLESTFTQSEWAAAFAQDPQGKKQKLVPVRIEACQLTGLLASIVYLDLVGLPENDARSALLGAFSIRNKPASAPAFPGTRTSQAPGVSPTQPAYPGATEAISAPIAEVLSTVAGNADNSRQLSAAQRLQFMRQLNEIVPQHFNMLLFAVNPPAGLIPPMPAAQGDRTSALLTWAEAPGVCGLSVLQEVLKTIVKSSVGPLVLSGEQRVGGISAKRISSRKKLWWLLGTLAAVAICSLILILQNVFYAEAKHYYDAGEFAKALPLLEMASALGSTDSMWHLGDVYKNASDVAKDDDKARNLYWIAAEMGNSLGMLNLGDMYEKGLGGAKNFERARYWYEKAANKGNSWGMFHLADLYAKGLGGAKDFERARYWYHRAADDAGNGSPKEAAAEALRRLPPPANSK